jgi:hypothetical protein
MWSILKPLISPAINKVLNLIPDQVERERADKELALELMKAVQIADSQQMEINKIEAQNPNLFVSGWRPFIGWVGGIAIAWVFLLHPVISYIVAIIDPAIKLPQVETENLLELVFAMLGMAGLRSYEKIRGVARK